MTNGWEYCRRWHWQWKIWQLVCVNMVWIWANQNTFVMLLQILLQMHRLIRVNRSRNKLADICRKPTKKIIYSVHIPSPIHGIFYYMQHFEFDTYIKKISASKQYKSIIFFFTFNIFSVFTSTKKNLSWLIYTIILMHSISINHCLCFFKRTCW